MPDAYLGRLLRCYLASRSGNGDFLGDLRRGVSDVTLAAELTRGVITAEGASSRVIVPIALDEQVQIGQITPTTPQTEQLSRAAGSAALVVLDYMGLGIDRALAGDVLIPQGGVTTPYEDLTNVALGLDQEAPWWDFTHRLGAAGTHALEAGETHVLLLLRSYEGAGEAASQLTVTYTGSGESFTLDYPASGAAGAALVRAVPAGATDVTVAVGAGWVPDWGLYTGSVHEPF